MRMESYGKHCRGWWFRRLHQLEEQATVVEHKKINRKRATRYGYSYENKQIKKYARQYEESYER